MYKNHVHKEMINYLLRGAGFLPSTIDQAWIELACDISQVFLN